METTCKDCHHRPSGRAAEYGAECYCKCHDAADAAPDLLAALKQIADTIQGGDRLETCEPWAQVLIGVARAAIAAAEGC